MNKAIHTRYRAETYTIIAGDSDARIHYRDDAGPKEEQHEKAMREFIRRKWPHSAEVLDPMRYRIVGGQLKPGEYVWCVERIPDTTLVTQFGCQHRAGYWIDKALGTFRCYACGFQLSIYELTPNKERCIEEWKEMGR